MFAATTSAADSSVIPMMIGRSRCDRLHRLAAQVREAKDHFGDDRTAHQAAQVHAELADHGRQALRFDLQHYLSAAPGAV